LIGVSIVIATTFGFWSLLSLRFFVVRLGAMKGVERPKSGVKALRHPKRFLGDLHA